MLGFSLAAVGGGAGHGPKSAVKMAAAPSALRSSFPLRQCFVVSLGPLEGTSAWPWEALPQAPLALGRV